MPARRAGGLGRTGLSSGWWGLGGRCDAVAQSAECLRNRYVQVQVLPASPAWEDCKKMGVATWFQLPNSAGVQSRDRVVTWHTYYEEKEGLA